MYMKWSLFSSHKDSDKGMSEHANKTVVKDGATGAFSDLSEDQKKTVLRSGAKSFSRDFAKTIEQLANE